MGDSQNKYTYYDFIVRLSASHDIDLIGLNADSNYKLSFNMKQAIIAWANGKPYKTFTPTTPIDNPIIIKNCCLHLYFNKETEAEVVKKLEMIRDQKQNNFIKNLFRACLDKPFDFPYIYTNKYIIETSKKRAAKQKEKQVLETKRLQEENIARVNEMLAKKENNSTEDTPVQASNYTEHNEHHQNLEMATDYQENIAAELVNYANLYSDNATNVTEYVNKATIGVDYATSKTTFSDVSSNDANEEEYTDDDDDLFSEVDGM